MSDLTLTILPATEAPKDITPGPYRVLIRDTQTGETAAHIQNSDWDGPDGMEEFVWTEGNFACDCNRGDFFYRAKGDERDDHQCGTDRFEIEIRSLDDTVLYSEF